MYLNLKSEHKSFGILLAKDSHALSSVELHQFYTSWGCGLLTVAKNNCNLWLFKGHFMLLMALIHPSVFWMKDPFTRLTYNCRSAILSGRKGLFVFGFYSLYNPLEKLNWLQDVSNGKKALVFGTKRVDLKAKFYISTDKVHLSSENSYISSSEF